MMIMMMMMMCKADNDYISSVGCTKAWRAGSGVRKLKTPF